MMPPPGDGGGKKKRPLIRRTDPELLADIAAAKQAKEEIIAQRTSLREVLEFLSTRRKINNFGSDLQITFRPRPRANRDDDNGLPAEPG